MRHSSASVRHRYLSSDPAPATGRAISAPVLMIRPYNMATGAAPFESLSVADIGDVPINTYSLLKSVQIIGGLLHRFK